MQTYTVGILLFLVLGLEQVTGGYKGCYKEDKDDRIFSTSAGDYQESSTTVMLCGGKCGELKEKYAALYDGKFCFCGSEEPVLSKKDDGSCTKTCNSADECGGSEHVSVYDSVQEITNLSLSITSQIDNEVEFSVTMDRTTLDIVYAMDYGDDYRIVRNEASVTELTKRHYHLPGKFTATVFAEGKDYTAPETQAVATVVVESDIKNVTVVCPEVVATFDEMDCQILIQDGISMEATVKFGDGTTQSFHIADATGFFAGHEYTASSKVLSEAAAKSYLKLSSDFQWDGDLVGWEFKGLTAGDVNLLVLKPVCSDAYCYTNRECGSCTHGLAEKCKSGAYCFATNLCDNTNTSTRLEPSTLTFKVVSVTPFTIKTGYNYVKMATAVPIKAGYIIGYEKLTGIIDATDMNDKDLYISTTASEGSVHQFQTMKKSAGSHLLKAIATRNSIVHLPHTYYSAKDFNIEVTVTGSKNTITATTTVPVQEGINYTIIDTKEHKAAYQGDTFKILPHTGNNVTYEWSFGDGISVNTSEPEITHTYDKTGMYNLSVSAWNLLSRKENNTFIFVEEVIKDLRIESQPIATNEEADFLISISNGTDFECSLAYGDGSDTKLDSSSFTLNTEIKHKYTQQNKYTVTIKCSNNISTETFSIEQLVVDPITELKLVEEGVLKDQQKAINFSISHGDNAAFTLTLDGTECPITYNPKTKTGSTNKVFNWPNFGFHKVVIYGTNPISNVTETFDFAVEEELFGVKSMVAGNMNKILYNESVTYTATKEGGSGVEVEWDFGDGDSHHSIWNDTEERSVTHTFKQAGNYSVAVNVFNKQKKLEFTHNILALAPIENLTLESNSPILFTPPGNIDFKFNITSNSQPPVDAYLTIDYGDGKSDTNLTFDLKKTYTHAYEDSGNFSIIATVANSIKGSSQTLSTKVQIIETLEELTLKLDPLYAILNEPVTISAYLYRGSTENVNFIWDMGDGTVKEIGRTGESPDTPDVYKHTYTKPGDYKIRVVAKSMVQNISVTKDIKCEEAVIACEVNINKPTRAFHDKPLSFTAEVTYKQLPPPGSFLCWFKETSNNQPNCCKDNPSSKKQLKTKDNINMIYNKAGVYRGKFVTCNSISKEETPFKVVVVQEITTMTTTVMYQPLMPLNSSNKPIVLDFLPLDLEANFHIKTDGTVEEYAVSFMNDGAPVRYNKTLSPVTFRWPKTGTFDVTISSENSISTPKTETMTINVINRITGVSLAAPDQSNTGNKTNITVSLPSISDKTCLVINLGDGSPAIVYGTQETCPEIYKTITPRSLRNEIHISHRFLGSGSFQVTAIASDLFGNFTSEKLVVISDAECFPPIIAIRNVNSSFTEPIVAKRNKLIRFLTKTTIQCKHTLKNIKLWTIYPADPNSGEINGEAIILADNPSVNFAELAIKPGTLDTGLYKVVYQVKMDPSEFPSKEIFQTTASEYLKVVSSDLIVMIENGGASERLWGINTTMILSPIKYCYDPDVPRDGDQGFTNFIWYCKGYKQRFDSVVNDEMVGPPGEYSTMGGCFGKGPGKIDFNSGNISFSTQWMKVNESYDFLVTAVKGERRANGTLRVKIVEGVPGSAMIECSPGLCTVATSGKYVNPSARIGLIAHCTEGCQMNEKKYQYQWEFYYFQYRWNWRKIENITHYVIGLHTKYAVVSKLIFQEFPSVEKFRAKVTIIDGQTEAETAMNILVNKAPKDGKCKIFPDSGLTGQTQFELSCVGWKDDQRIDQYMFYAEFKDSTLQRQIGFGIDSNVTVFMPLGPDYDNYTMQVYAKVFDPLGAYTIYHMGPVQVRPMPQEKLQGILDELGNGTVADLDQVAANGDLQETNTVFSTFASALNSASKEMDKETYANKASIPSTGYGRDYDHRVPNEVQEITEADFQEQQANKFNSKAEQDRSLRAKGRAMMVEALNSITVSTMSGIQVTSSTLSTICKYPEECGRKAQEAVLRNIENMSEMFVSLGKDTPKEELTVAGESLLAVIGETLEATNYHINDPILSDMEDIAETMVYDTDLDSEQDSIVSDDPQKGLNELKYIANKEQQTKDAMEKSSKIMGSMNSVTTTISSALVPGDEPLKMTTPKMGMSMEMTSVKSLGIKKIGEGRGAFNLPDFCKMKPSCDPDEVVSLETMATPGNIFSFAKNKAASLKSGTMGIHFKSGGNEEISIQNTEEPIEIIIPREITFRAPKAQFVDPVLVKNETLFFHTFWANNTNSSLHIEIKPDNASVQLLVFVRFNNTPNITTKEWDYFQMVPSRMDLAVNYSEGNWPNPYMVFVSDKIVGNFTGRVYVGVRQLDEDEMDLYDDNATIPDFKPKTGQFTTNYTLRTFTSGCLYFKESITDWVTDGCYVGYHTNINQTQCFCNHMSAFSAGLVVAPNAIDWDRVLQNASFAENPTLYITQIVILLVYLSFAGWAYRQDKKDTEKLGLTPLEDNNPYDKYYYEIIVATGMGKDSGTTSKVFFILSGEYDETEPRSLTDDKRKILQRGSVDGFLMAVPRPLGALSYVRIWHDNSGKGKFGSWYLKHFLVRDLQTGVKYHFMSNKWLAVEKDDGQVDRIIPVAGKEELLNFSHMFAKRAQKNLGDGHLWFSVIGRPPGSPFTRLQRVSCCLCLLFTSMFANALYYGKESGGGAGFSFGPFSLSIETISMGFVSNLIVLPVNLIVVTLFRKSKPRKEKPSRIEQALKESNRCPRVTSVNDVIMTGWEDMTRSQTKLIGSDMDLSRPGTSMSRPHTPAVRKNASDRDKKKKKPFMFPWWCRIISWILLWLSVAGCCAGVTFYGITFGNEKCTKWISSMLISFFSSVFITEPIKVFVLAILLSLILKKPAEEDEEEEETLEMAEDEEFLHSSNGFGAAKPKKSAYKPPDQESLGKMREQRLKEIKMWEVIKEITYYAFFLWILMVISYRNRSPDAFRTKVSLENILVHHPSNDFIHVNNTQGFWSWAKTNLVDALRATKYYNGAPPLLLRGYLSDKTSRIMGYAVMRQLRANTKPCKMVKQFDSLDLECHREYSLFNEDKELYGTAWEKPANNDSYSNLADEFKYTDSSKLDGYPYYGVLTMYGGGGYVARLKGSKAKLTNLMERLQNTSWIDKFTRAVFVEFTIYNPQVNLFTVCTMLAEFTRVGSVVTSYRFEPCMLLPYMTQAALFQTLCDVVFVIFLIYFLIKEIKLLIKLRKNYFKEFWNLVELAIIVMSTAGIFIFIYKLLETKRLTELFRKTQGNKYMKFQFVAYWNELFGAIVGCIVFFATLKFMKLLRFNRRISMLSSTLKNCTSSLLNFSLVFWIFFLAFVQIFYLLFFREMKNFSNFITSSETGFLMIIGSFDFDTMKLIQPMLSPIIFFLFNITISYVLVNMFISILNEAFASVKEDIKKQNNEHEIVNFMVGRFKLWTGIGMPGTVYPEELNGKKSKSGILDSLDGQIEQFPDKVDQLLNTISHVYMENDTLEAFFNNRNETGKRTLKMMKQNQTQKAYQTFPNEAYGFPKGQK